jgi:hypothetical protein
MNRRITRRELAVGAAYDFVGGAIVVAALGLLIYWGMGL